MMLTTILICFIIEIYPFQVDSVTPVNPCDPEFKATVKELYSTEEIETIFFFESPSWMRSPLVFVNCSARGLAVVPSTVVPHNLKSWI